MKLQIVVDVLVFWEYCPPADGSWQSSYRNVGYSEITSVVNYINVDTS